MTKIFRKPFALVLALFCVLAFGACTPEPTVNPAATPRAKTTKIQAPLENLVGSKYYPNLAEATVILGENGEPVNMYWIFDEKVADIAVTGLNDVPPGDVDVETVRQAIKRAKLFNTVSDGGHAPEWVKISEKVNLPAREITSQFLPHDDARAFYFPGLIVTIYQGKLAGWILLE